MHANGFFSSSSRRRFPVKRGLGSHQQGRALALVLVIALAVALAGGAWWYFKHKPASEPDAGAGKSTSAKGDAAKADGRKGDMRDMRKGGRGGDGKPVPVTVRPVEQTDLPEMLQAVGTVTAMNTALVRPRVDGVLVSIGFREGDRVAAGDVLAQIDPQPFEVAVRTAEGALERDRALLKNAELDLQRFEDLWQKESIARQQLDTQKALVAQLKGSVQSDQAAVDAARLNLSYTRIRAPIAGRLGLRQLDVGNTVRAGDATGLVTIVQDNPVAVVFAVPDLYVGRIQARLKSGRELPLEALDKTATERLSRGRLLSADNALDLTTGTLRLKGLFPNADQKLFPNQSVTVRLALGVRSAVLTVPAAAVQRGADSSFVYVVDEEQSVSLIKVQTGLTDRDRTEITGELQAGMRVVTEGTDRLRPGAKVEVIEPGEKGGQGGQVGQSGKSRKGAAPKPDTP